MTVQELRQKGFKVRVKHERMYEYFLTTEDGENYRKIREVSPFGGKTRVEVKCPTGEELVGEAVCSNKENFCYKRGVKISIGRIEKQMGQMNESRN